LKESLEAEMNKKLTKTTSLALTVIAMALLAGCGSGDGGTTVNGDVPMAYVQRSTEIDMNPTDGTSYHKGGDLIVRGLSDGSASETNVTASITRNNEANGEGDVSDPEASYDGKKIVFALRCPTSNPAKIPGTATAACTGHWNLWEYDMTDGGYAKGTLRRITSSNQYDDVDPAYLPAGAGFVFASNRQQKTRNNQALGQAYRSLDEYERETVINLHTIAADGNEASIVQISTNQSHDRNPVVTTDGDIMFSRWEHVGDRNRFAIFTVKPDGKSMFVRYGAQSAGNSFLHPREMDPNGPYKGFYTSSLMPLSRTQEGGALMFIDANSYSEQDTPATKSIARTGGQVQGTRAYLNDGRGFSPNGRITTPFPLWDGTNRVLVAYRPCNVERVSDGAIISCISPELTQADKDKLGDMQRSTEDMATDRFRDTAPASYAIHMFNPATGKMDPVAVPPSGYMYTDPIPLQARKPPRTADLASSDPSVDVAALIAADQGTLEVRSVYDTDKLGRMSNGMLVPADLGAGCVGTDGVAMKTAPDSPTETRANIADLSKITDPQSPQFNCSPLRWIRVARAVAPKQNMMGIRSAIGETDFEQQQILGYAPIEPDGSFKIKVPADTPIALSVIDTKGRAIQTHTNWIQVRPGETRTCNGCHSPRRGASINDGAATLPTGLLASLRSAHTAGSTMANTRTPAGQDLVADMAFTDAWVEPAFKRPALAIKYTGNTNPADDMTTTAPATTGLRAGIINYPQHIAPIWAAARGGNTCTTCHNASDTVLNLEATTAGTGRLVSYEELVVGDPVLEANGMPKIRFEDGAPMIVRGSALVETSSSFANSAGGTRKSRLGEIMFGEVLKAGTDATDAHPNPPSGAPNHSTMLTLGEKRVIAEWMDLGGQYYNDPFDAGAGTIVNSPLTEASFAAQVQPILAANCMASCHMAVASPTVAAGGSFRGNRYVLTGSTEGDFGATLSMISNVCAPADNLLLKRPSTINPHPAGAGNLPVLDSTGAAYNAIRSWIQSGC
jgi:hypothetical protein